MSGKTDNESSDEEENKEETRVDYLEHALAMLLWDIHNNNPIENIRRSWDATEWVELREKFPNPNGE